MQFYLATLSWTCTRCFSEEVTSAKTSSHLISQFSIYKMVILSPISVTPCFCRVVSMALYRKCQELEPLPPAPTDVHLLGHVSGGLKPASTSPSQRGWWTTPLPTPTPAELQSYQLGRRKGEGVADSSHLGEGGVKQSPLTSWVWPSSPQYPSWGS